MSSSGPHGPPSLRMERSPTTLDPPQWIDRKSTRLNSSHVKISYAVFCLKKTKTRLNATFRNIRWIDYRLSFVEILTLQLHEYPSPCNLRYSSHFSSHPVITLAVMTDTRF